EPIVLLRHIRQRALAGELQGRHADRLVLLHVGFHAGKQGILRPLRMAGTQPTLSGDQIRDANVRYHDAAAANYDSKWAIDYGDIGGGQVVAKLEKALGRAPTHYGRMLRSEEHTSELQSQSNLVC